MPDAKSDQKRQKRSSYYDADVLAWLRKRGEIEDRSVDWLVRQILRAAFERDGANAA